LPLDVIVKYTQRNEIISNLEYYINVRSTADVESFNNVITIYTPKRLHFRYYKMRVALAILHWNDVDVPEQGDWSIMMIKRKKREFMVKGITLHHKPLDFVEKL